MNMRLRSFLQNLRESVPTVSKQDAIDRKWFGPVFHGTTAVNRDAIDREGFRLDANRSNGYRMTPYVPGGQIPAPIHHLGNGIYFTTVRAIAQKYNGETAKGLNEYYLDVPRLETINFASPNTMMKWWIANGYDFKVDPAVGEEMAGDARGWDALNRRQKSAAWMHQEQARATVHMTEYLSSRYDAVWFKGKTMYKVLDGDQVCVYDPSRIHRVDASLAKPMDVGSKVRFNGTVYLDYGNGQEARLGDVDANGGRYMINQNGGAFHWIPAEGMKGVILDKRPISPEQRRYLPARAQNQAEFRYTVKWAKGGTRHNYLDTELDPI